jgi:hypothetical protein
MSKEEKEEYRNLKYARAEQGFFLPEQKERWNYLHDLLGNKILKKIKIMEEKRQMKLN